MATAASYREPQTESQVPQCRRIQVVPPVKFDAAFLERRLQAHRELQERETAELATGIILEVAWALEQV